MQAMTFQRENYSKNVLQVRSAVRTDPKTRDSLGRWWSDNYYLGSINAESVHGLPLIVRIIITKIIPTVAEREEAKHN